MRIRCADIGSGALACGEHEGRRVTRYVAYAELPTEVGARKGRRGLVNLGKRIARSKVGKALGQVIRSTPQGAAALGVLDAARGVARAARGRGARDAARSALNLTDTQRIAVIRRLISTRMGTSNKLKAIESILA